jgi:RimJ/RimL family protein N-acetyltransferase
MYLRQFRPEDAQLLFELDADPEVMRFISKVRELLWSASEIQFHPTISGTNTDSLLRVESGPRICGQVTSLSVGSTFDPIGYRPERWI